MPVIVPMYLDSITWSVFIFTFTSLTVFEKEIHHHKKRIYKIRGKEQFIGHGGFTWELNQKCNHKFHFYGIEPQFSYEDCNLD